jgi:hypothetical protein
MRVAVFDISEDSKKLHSASTKERRWEICQQLRIRAIVAS